MKTKRGLSGIYFRVKNKETGKFETTAFEDLSEEQQDEVMKNKDIEFIKSLAKQLTNTLNGIGDQLDLTIGEN